MARYTDSVCKLCRREGIKLFLKGERCFKEKCAIDKRNYAPGQHGKSKTKLSDYGVQLREKQKTKRIYGVLERQFREYFHKATTMKGITGENLLVMLERRFDNVIYRSGFATSRAQARQLITHSHFRVNGRKLNIPSFLVRAGDVIEVREKSRNMVKILESLESAEGRGVPSWILLDKGAFKSSISKLPERKDIPLDIKEHLIVELYSK